MTDAIGRSWQMGTIQLDFQMPARFELSYVGADDADHVPVVIHRALLGSLDGSIGIPDRAPCGAFPLWDRSRCRPSSCRRRPPPSAARSESGGGPAGGELRAEADLQSGGKKIAEARASAHAVHPGRRRPRGRGGDRVGPAPWQKEWAPGRWASCAPPSWPKPPPEARIDHPGSDPASAEFAHSSRPREGRRACRPSSTAEFAGRVTPASRRPMRGLTPGGYAWSATSKRARSPR